MKRWGFLALLVALAAVSIPAHAARTFTIAQTAPAPAGEVDMGTTQTLTYTITNTASGGNAGERIYRMRFRLTNTCTGGGCTATLFSTASAAPANWTRTSFSTTSVTYTAATWADAIPSGSSLSFSVVVTAGKSSQDRTETLRDARASFTTDTDFSNGISNAGSSTISAPAGTSWILQSLQITGFQTTDTSGTPTSAIAAGVSFRIVITVKNISIATQNGIVANPSPPTATKTGSFGGSSPSCSLLSTSPSPFNLATSASGTMTYTCTTLSSDSGTVTYSVTDVRTGASVTSRSGTSNVLSISPLSVSIAVTGPYPADATCHFSGDTAKFVMTVTNNTGAPLTSVTPSALTRGGASTTIGAFTGPTAACTLPVPNGGSCTYTWTAPVTIVGSYPSSGPKPTFFVTGSASATNPGAITSPTVQSNTQDVEGFVVTVAPTTTNTDSANQEFTFSLLNSGCANVNQVAITAPGAFSFSGDGYSLINSTAEDWTQTGTTFAAGTVLPTGASGDFSLVFAFTPSATGTYTFSLNVTDQNAVSKTVTVDVPVAAFGSGTLNLSSPATWREVFQ